MEKIKNYTRASWEDVNQFNLIFTVFQDDDLVSRYLSDVTQMLNKPDQNSADSAVKHFLATTELKLLGLLHSFRVWIWMFFTRFECVSGDKLKSEMQKVRDLESQIEVLKTEKQKSPDDKWKFHFLSLKRRILLFQFWSF